MEGFAGVMKYFRQMLMGHETFLKFFDGPQKFFFILFPNFNFHKIHLKI